MMKRLIAWGISLMLVGLLAGCGDKDNTLPPAALVKFTPTLNVQPVWSRAIGNGADNFYLRLTPAADNGTIFAAGYNGTIVAVNATNGGIVWSNRITSSIASGLAAGNGKVYFVTSNAELFALSEQDGHVLWHVPVSNEVLGAPQYAQGYVLANTISGNLSCYSADDGHLVWRLDEHAPSLTLHAAGQPQVAGNRVVAGFSNGKLAVVDIDNGQVVWERQVATAAGDNPISNMVDITVNPIVVRGVVYAATYQGQVAAYSLDDGQLIWSHQISSYAGIAANESQLIVSDAESHVWAFDENSGGVDWKQNQLLGRQITGPVIYKNAVAVADNYGYVHFMSLEDGHFLARLSIGNGILAQPIVYQGNVYVMTSAGKLIDIRGG